MFYEELYTVLGKLFYYIASIKGSVKQPERKSLDQLIQKSWKPLGNSVDAYDTDEANPIDFSFDFEESEIEHENGFEVFKQFYEHNKSKYSPEIICKILQTTGAIAFACRGQNKSEKKIRKNCRIYSKNRSLIFKKKIEILIN
jgi:hypothetical protein